MKKVLVCLITLMSLFASKAWGDVTWSLSSGTLTFSYSGYGSSAMTDYVNADTGTPKRPITWPTQVTNVVINEGVTTIGSFVFQGCANITSIHIPTSVTECKEGAFIGCNGLANIYYAGTPNQWANIDFTITDGECDSHPFYASTASNRSFYFYDKNTETTELALKTGITTIKPYAFYKANRFSYTYIPGTVTSIGTHALDCPLTRLHINKKAAPTTGTTAISWKTSSTYLYLRADATNSYNKQPWYNTTSGTSTGAKTLGYNDATATRITSPWGSGHLHNVNGTIGTINWTLDEDGTLTLSGNGAIAATYDNVNAGTGKVVLPWFRFKQLINKVVIQSDGGDITGLSNALQYCYAIDEIIIKQTTIPTMTFNTNSSFRKSTDKIKVYVDISSEGAANLSTSPWNGSNLDIEYTTTFCGDPSGLSIGSIGTTSATASWTDDRADTWKYLCLPASYGAPLSEDWEGATSTNSKSATISGLNPGSNYVFYVMADCGAVGESDFIYEVFTTECGTIAHIDLPWSENFNTCDNDVTPPCWTQLKSGSGYTQATSYQYRGSNGKSLRIAGGTSSSTGYAVFPQFADDIKTLTLTFYYRSNVNDEYYTYGQAQIGYITNLADKTTFVPIETLEKINSWTKVENFMVPDNTPDGAYFAIRYYGSGSAIGYVHIDDITVREKPACVIPTNVAASSITNSGATISWDANDMTAWVLQVSANDDEHWGEDINAATNSKALTGLDDNTLYYVRVKADCGIYGDSEWSDAISFRTECDAIDIDASTPWSEDFNAMSEEIVPECWNNSASTATPYWDASYYIWGTYNAGSGNKMLRMSNASVDGGIALINTPAFAIPDDGKEYEFMFDYANHASSDLIVKMSVDGSAFGVVNTYHNTGSNSVNPGELTSETISLYGHNGSTVKLQFYTTPASGYYSTDGAMFVDNVGVRKVPTCFQPTALAASSITANSAHLTWTAGASESSWKLQYRASGGEWSEDITVNTTAAKDLESLSAHTTYEVRVKAWCNIDDFSEWSETASFTTLCAAESMPFSEEFSLTTSLPACWEASSNNWSGDYQGSNGWARLHTGYSGTATLCTPPVNLNADAVLRFKWKNANGTAVNLYISTDRGETMTLITDELSYAKADWTTMQYNLSAYTGEEAQFYFIATFSTQNQYAYLDDVEVFAIPTEVFLDNASATDNEDRLEDLMGQIANITINRPLLRNGDYCTLTLPFDLSAAQIADENCPLHGFTIKEFESSESGDAVNIYLTEVSEIEAGKPYFVRYAGTPNNNSLTPLTFRYVTVAAYQPESIELTDDCTPHGVFNPYPLVKDDVSTLFLSSNNTLYYPSANGTMNGFRAYIKVGGALSAPIRRGAPIRIVEKENTTTGIQNTDAKWASQIQKILRDGQIIIIRGEHMYNAQGMRIQ